MASPVLHSALIGLAVAALATESVCAQESRPKLDVHFMATPENAVDRMLAMAKVTDQDFVIDLGSGDGRIVIAAAKKFGARGLGVDLDPERIKEANENLQKAGVGGKVEFRQQNLFETDLSRATVLTMFLVPSLNLQLRSKLLELKPGTRLASYAFDMGDWRPDRHVDINGVFAYLWVVPAKVNGRWQAETARRKFELDLSQQYQTFKGVARFSDRNVVIRETSLQGDHIRFVIEFEEGKPERFHGRVVGERIEAVSDETGEPVHPAGGWRASRGP